MAKQRFDSQELRNTQKIQKKAFYIVAAITLALMLIRFPVVTAKLVDMFEPEARESSDYIVIMLLGPICALESFLVMFVPIGVLFFGYQRGRGKALRENITFNSSLGITYYRDFLKGVSPALMSIMMDTGVEDTKDISATMLRMYDKKIIDFNGGKVVCMNQDVSMSEDERELYVLFQSGGLMRSDAWHWKKNREDEAIRDGYIWNNYRRFQKNQERSGCLYYISFLTPVVVGVIITLVFGEDILDKVLCLFSAFIFGEVAPMSLKNIHELSVSMQAFAVGFLPMMLGAFLPFFIAARMMGYGEKKSRFSRTSKGDELAEKVAGLQRFIHDFSNLSEVQKEQVALWNDFLVYAVALEENTEIVKDISRLFNKNVSGVYGVVNYLPAGSMYRPQYTDIKQPWKYK